MCCGLSVCSACVPALRRFGPPITGERIIAAFVLGGLAVCACLVLAFAVPVGSGLRPEPQLYVLNLLAGVLVGAAVRVGSRLRGGVAFQGIACLLVYPAIVSTYVPFVLTTVVGPGKVNVIEDPSMLLTGYLFGTSYPFLMGPVGIVAVVAAFLAAALVNLRLPRAVEGPFHCEETVARG